MRSLLDLQDPRLLREMSREEGTQFVLALKADQAARPPVPIDLELYLTQDVGLAKDSEEYLLLGHPFRIFLNRLRVRANKLVTKPLANFLMFLTGGHLAQLVMYAHALHLGTPGKELVTMDDLVRLFPHGIPTEAAMREYWDSTKAVSEGGDGSRSALDFGTAWVLPG